MPLMAVPAHSPGTRAGRGQEWGSLRLGAGLIGMSSRTPSMLHSDVNTGHINKVCLDVAEKKTKASVVIEM